MVEIKYKLTYTIPALNRFVQACDLGIESFEWVPKSPTIMTLKINRDISEIDDGYIDRLAKHIENLPENDGYKISKAIYISTKKII